MINFITENKECLCDHGGFYSIISKKGNISEEMYTTKWRKYLLKIGNKRVCWDYIQVETFLI